LPTGIVVSFVAADRRILAVASSACTRRVLLHSHKTGRTVVSRCTDEKEDAMAKDHGPSIKNDKQYEGLRKKGMSKQRAARIANSPGSSKRGGKSSGKKSS
jgi:hypothetical protein